MMRVEELPLDVLVEADDKVTDLSASELDDLFSVPEDYFVKVLLPTNLPLKKS